MATLNGYWNSYRGLLTTLGTFRSGYHSGAPNEWVTVWGPGEQHTDVPTPALVDWFLAAENGSVTVYYLRGDGGSKTEVRVPTAIACGQPVGALTTGGTGPAGVAGAAGAKGDTGDTGPRGTAGAAGVAFLTGRGIPTATLGRVGDSYLDVTTGDVYERT